MRIKSFFGITIASLAMLLLATGASAGSSYTLHPAGFGAHSYAAWKAQQGLPDSQGNDNQALYFQKDTTTGTFAAGVAVIRGVEGLKLSELTGLAWAHREDGHCGAGAPRWNIGVKDSAGNTSTIFLGCNAAQHAQLVAPTATTHGWCEDTQTSPAAMANADQLTITGLSIVFDEGTDTPNPPPAGCAQEQLTGGFVYLDNIEVDVNGTPHCWTSANDNGSGGGSGCPPMQSSSTASTSSLSLSMPTGLAVDPTDTGMVTALNLAYPGVPLTSWTLYPNVVP